MTNNLITRLNYIKNWKCNGDSEMYETINDAIAALERTEPQWILCTDRLPDKECFCLVTINDGGIYTDLSAFKKDGEFIEHTGDVVAWMPLPEPYQEGEISMSKVYDVFTDEYIDRKDIDPIAPPERYKEITDDLLCKNAARWIGEELLGYSPNCGAKMEVEE